MAESEESSSSSWRFSMELLSHVHTLRVFLFNSSPEVKPRQDCVCLAATLLTAPPTLSCTWKTAHQPSLYSLRLPLPLLLFDYFAAPRISTLPDCIQLSLPLLPLPPFHLYAFSSLSLAHDDDIHTHNPDGIHMHNSNDISGVHHEAFHTYNDVHSDGISHSSDGDKSHTHDDTHEQQQPTHGPYHKDDKDARGTHEIRQEEAATALNFSGCHNDGMSEVHADNCVHGHDNGVCASDDACKSHEHNVTDDVRRVASSVLDISGCHHNGMNEVDHDAIEAGEDIHRVCLHADHAHVNPPTHASSVCSQPHNDGIKACEHPTHYSDCSSLHDHENVASEGSLQCQHGRNVADLLNNGSSLQSDSMPLDSSTHQGHEDQISQGAAIFCCKKCLVKVSKNPVRNLVQLPCFDWRDIVENWFGACCCSFGSKAEILSARFEKSLKLRPGKCLVGPSTFYVDFSDVTVETEAVVLNTDSKIRQWSTLHFLALGNGFMVWENQQSKYFSWQPVYCTGCASLIGAYACKPTDSGLIREGLHLFQCQITAFNADGTPYDTCRGF